MNEKLKLGLKILASLVVLWGVYHLFFTKQVNFGTAVDCNSITCFTTVGVLTSLQDDGTLLLNGAVTLASSLTQTSGNIIQVSSSQLAIFPGTVIENNVIQSSGGYSQTVTGNTTVTVAQWCAGTQILIPVGAPALTITLPVATSTFTGCGATVGAWSQQWIDNQSSNNVTIATGTGMTNGDFNFMYASGTPFAIYPPKILATTTVSFTGIYATSSPRVIFDVFMAFYAKPF